jgi:large subunit ribosomal protein L29
MAKEKLNLVEMSDDDLRSHLASVEREYQQLKFDHAAKGIANPMEIRKMRRDIARILTEGRRREIAAMDPYELEQRSKLRARRRKNR